MRARLSAIGKSQAVISFDLTGRVLDANPNFLAVIGYRLEEVAGQHHSMFVEPGHRDSFEYRSFWEKLGRGEFDAGRYRRVTKDGRELWIQASYNPILDPDGKPFKVVKYATDITEQVLAARAQEEAVAQTEAMVAEAQRNEFTRRIPLEGKTGAIGRLCGGVNSIVDTLEQQHAMSEALKRAVAETQVIVSAAQTNDLSRRIDMTGKTGEIGELCSGLNGMLDTMSGVLATIPLSGRYRLKPPTEGSGGSGTCPRFRAGGRVAPRSTVRAVRSAVRCCRRSLFRFRRSRSRRRGFSDGAGAPARVPAATTCGLRRDATSWRCRSQGS